MKGIYFWVLLFVVVSGCSSYTPEVQNEIDECGKIVGWGDCEMALAIEHNDISICKRIKNAHYEKVCKMIVGKEYDRCVEINEWDFSKSNPSLRDSNYDPKVFAKAQVEAMLSPNKDAILGICYSWSAKLQNNIEICDTLINNRYKNSCKLQFPDFSRYDLCLSEEYDYDKYTCFRLFALSEKNMSICKEITDISEQENCIAIVVGDLLKKPELCDEISKSSRWYDVCLTNSNRTP